MDNFYSRCLLCTCIPDVTPHLHVFSQAGTQLQLADKIYKYLNIQIDAELPQNVCHSCMAKLEVTHELVTSSQQAIINLLHIKQQEVKQENCAMMEFHQPATDSAAIYIENEMENSYSEDFDQSVNILPDHLDEEHITVGNPIAEGTQEKMEPFEEVLISEIKIEEHPINLETKDQLQHLPQISDVPLKECQVLVAKLLECDFCCFYTDNKTQLATHMQAHLHAPDEPRKRPANKGWKLNHKCAECGLKYRHPEMMRWHTENCHGPAAIVKVEKLGDTIKYNFQCVFCQTVCKSMESTIQHLHSRHQIRNLPYPCSLCGKSFTEMYELKRHQAKCKKIVKCRDSSTNLNHLKNSLKCKICGTSFESEKLLKSHITDCHSRKRRCFKCVYCEESFSFFRRLKSHCQTEHPGKYVLKCETCQAEFNSYNGYTHHRKNKHRETHDLKTYQRKCKNTKNVNFNCLYCDESFSCIPHLKSHCKTKHPGEKYVVKCELCEAKFNSYNGYREHRKNKHEGREFSCDICKTKFTSRQGLIYHQKYGHETRVFTCNICSAIVSSPSSLRAHIKIMHSLLKQPFSCQFCSAEFKCKKYLRNHVRKVHTGKILHCDHCKYNTRVRASLTLHLSVKHLLLKNTFVCQFCSAKFKCKEYLRNHVRDVHKCKILHCDHCKFTSNKKSILALHFTRKHSLVKNTFACNFCSAKFKCKPYLLQHVQNIHTGKIHHCSHCKYNTRRKLDLICHFTRKHSLVANTFSCKLCSAKFKSKQYLSNHVWDIHTGKILYCNHCKYNTRRKNRLTMHIRVKHSLVETLFPCQFCSAKFKCKQYLQNHVRKVHTGPILQCDHCRYNTRKRHNLMDHFRVKHSLVETLFSCQLCSAKFKCKPYLSKHVKNVHT